MASTYTKTCPDCGAVNDANDLFCKDCGTSLAMVGGTSQQTSSFTPAASDGTQTTTIAPAAALQYTPVETPVYQPQPSQSYYSHEESPRGAVLGWLAATLMLIILAAFIWSTVISDATRDRITGIF